MGMDVDFDLPDDWWGGGGDMVAAAGDGGNWFSQLAGGMQNMSPGAALLAMGGANALGGLLGANAAKEAARLQALSGQSAADKSMAMFNTVRGDLTPYNILGLGATPSLARLTGSEIGGNPLTAALTRPFQPTMDELEKTPGYQFTLDQGTKAVKNQFAARGLGGMSGALGKGLVNFASGTASTTYNDQFKNYLAQNQQVYNMLRGLVQGGQNAAAQTGDFGTQAQTTANNLNTGSAAATAGGIVGSSNAMSGAMSNIGNTLVTNSLLQGMFGGR